MNDSFPPVTIRDSELRFLKSRLLGKEYKIQVALPAGYAESKETYPVLYLLDADNCFGDITETVRFLAAVGKTFSMEVPDMIVVGIGYPLDFAKPSEYYTRWGSARSKDLTPTKVEPNALWPLSGGASDFMAFIRDDLKPLINSNYRANPEDNTILGVSFGGLFALYVLFHRPDTFNRYIVLSPSLWWDKKVTFDYEREYANEHTELPARLFLSIGSLEKNDSQDHLREFVQILKKRNYKGLEWASHICEGENHITAFYAAKCRAILLVFSSPKKD
ncbi:MAG: alpha/beta hydrolase-fold protein [Candidatus Bathyarchaeia archaeon]